MGAMFSGFFSFLRQFYTCLPNLVQHFIIAVVAVFIVFGLLKYFKQH